LESVHGGWASPESAAMWDSVLKAGNWRGDPVLNQAVQIPGVLRTRLRETLIDDAEWYASEGWNEPTLRLFSRDPPRATLCKSTLFYHVILRLMNRGGMSLGILSENRRQKDPVGVAELPLTLQGQMR